HDAVTVHRIANGSMRRLSRGLCETSHVGANTLYVAPLAYAALADAMRLALTVFREAAFSVFVCFDSHAITRRRIAYTFMTSVYAGREGAIFQARDAGACPTLGDGYAKIAWYFTRGAVSGSFEATGPRALVANAHAARLVHRALEGSASF